jgi:hypothetical protein
MIRRSRRGLASGHGIDEIVDADDFQIDIAASCVNEVIAANGREIAIARVHDHVEPGIGQLQPCGERNRAAMRSVKGVELPRNQRRDQCSRCQRPARWT